MSVLMREEGWQIFPLFVNYGQINLDRERRACLAVFERLGLPTPKEVDLGGFGASFPSGLTTAEKSITAEAFLPGRNMLFLLCAAAYAFERDAEAIAIGFLDERLSLFPDQTRRFADSAEDTLSLALGKRLRVITPLITLEKGEVLEIARMKGVSGTYSCHAGMWPPCGQCIACREYDGLEVCDGR